MTKPAASRTMEFFPVGVLELPANFPRVGTKTIKAAVWASIDKKVIRKAGEPNGKSWAKRPSVTKRG